MKKRALCIAAVALAILSLLALMLGLYRVGKRQYLLRKYPVAYVAEIRESAARYRLNPYMVIAVIRSESSFRPDAESAAGALGLMQIMPSTGAWIAEEQGLAGEYEEAWLLAPEKNVELGCWYLRYLADLFDGDFQKMICAYNAGQGNVAKWLDNPAYAENERLVEIPFPETAAYYDNVVAAYRHYMALYPALFAAPDAEDVVAVGNGCYNTVSEGMPC